jgi:pseudaminic acid synthase
MNVQVYKVASFEITDIPLIEHIAAKGKPVIISTGIATLHDIEEALDACYRMGNSKIALLKCTSQYPAPIGAANLKTIPNLSDTFRTVVGLSDHTVGSIAPVVAVTLGAKIVEKHFILDRKQGGPDASFSLEPQEFKEMVLAVREAEQAVGKVNYHLSDTVKRSRELCRSLFVVDDLKRGDLFTPHNIRSVRPGFGMHPRYLSEALGRRARKEICRGTPLQWDLID